MSKVIYMNCPKCGAKMAKSPGICASIPPKYEFRCPQCGEVIYTPKFNTDVVNDLTCKGQVIPDEWKLFRREAAKDILCEMLSTKQETSPQDITTAISIADELIKQLREGGK